MSLKKKGAVVIFADDKKKQKKDRVKTELTKHKGKNIADLNKKQLEDVARYALQQLDAIDNANVII